MNIEQLIAKEAARQAGVARYHAQLHHPENVAIRFWSKVTKMGEDECWDWHGCLSDCGYGLMTHKRKHWKAHRFAYFLTYGEFDPLMDVLHKCDNPKCCNPAHLKLGTASENMRDAYARGRKIPWNPKGSIHPMAKINEQQAIEIRTLFATGTFSKRAIGKRFGITASAVGSIVKRRTWSHV